MPILPFYTYYHVYTLSTENDAGLRHKDATWGKLATEATKMRDALPRGGGVKDIEDDGRKQEIYDKLLEGPLRKNLGSDPANKIKSLGLPNILLHKQAYEIIHK